MLSPPPLADSEPAAPLYDPPMFSPGQLRTLGGIGKALKSCWMDVPDDGTKDAFLTWWPEYATIAHKKNKDDFVSDIGVHILTALEGVKALSHSKRVLWFQSKVVFMKTDLEVDTIQAKKKKQAFKEATKAAKAKSASKPANVKETLTDKQAKAHTLAMILKARASKEALKAKGGKP